MKRLLLLTATHLACAAFGVALGIYLLPILAAPPAPTAGEVRSAGEGALFEGEFRRDLKDSDALHWGEGKVRITRTAVTLDGRLAPGPAYRLYLVPEFVETEEAFHKLKARSLPVGEIRTFENFIVPLAPDTRLEDYRAVVVWCESFSQFITAARYR